MLIVLEVVSLAELADRWTVRTQLIVLVMRGAAMSKGGKPIIAMPSITLKGHSKIAPFLRPGAGVVTTRAHVHYVVTEWGVASLYGKNLKQRAEALCAIAHPAYRPILRHHIDSQYWTSTDYLKIPNVLADNKEELAKYR